MDAKTRDLLRLAQITGDYTDYYAYLQALRRSGDFSLQDNSDARFELCAQRYLANNVDFFLSFLRFQYGDLSALFALPGRQIILARLELPQEQTAQFIAMGFVLFDDSGSGLGTFVGAEAECRQFEIAVIDTLGEGGVAPDEAGLDAFPCLTLHEIENIFGIANCLAPTLSRSEDLSWRGRQIGDLQYSIVYSLTDQIGDDPRYRNLRITKLGVIVPRWHNDIYFTTDDIIEPGRPSIFIFEVRNDHNEAYWGLYRPYTDPTVNQFIVEDHTPLLPGELPGGTIEWSPITLLHAPEIPADVLPAIHSALASEEMPTDGGILWLPVDLPRRAIIPSVSKGPDCPACQRLAPYKRLCRRHAPRF